METHAHIRSPRSAEDRSALIAVTVFPVIIIASAVLALIVPDVASTITPYINILLGVIMFGMGLTLTLPDFKLVFTRPLPILIGVVAQFLIMPLLAVILAKVFALPAAVATGVILVGCAPGGTASNVISYLAKADVALSVTMTSISTLLAPIITPFLTKALAGSYMAVNAGDMAISIVKMVLVPVVGGLVIRLVFPKLVEAVLPVLPWISTFGIAAVLAAVIPGAAGALKSAGFVIFLVVILHNVCGYLLGYLFAKALKTSERSARTVSIEVGMQNSGLAVTLAKTHFAATPETALPGAIFSLWHNLSGAVLAMIYRRNAARVAEREAERVPVAAN